MNKETVMNTRNKMEPLIKNGATLCICINNVFYYNNHTDVFKWNDEEETLYIFKFTDDHMYESDSKYELHAVQYDIIESIYVKCSAQIAEKICKEVGYSDDEMKEVTSLIEHTSKLVL